jgi:uncharacterized protein (DUF433 family)
MPDFQESRHGTIRIAKQSQVRWATTDRRRLDMTTDAVLERHIERSPDVAGGKPTIIGHRITVQNVVIWHERIGLSADEIASEYDLTLSEVYAALAYYYDHRAEIDASIRADEALVQDLRRITPSKLPETLRG